MVYRFVFFSDEVDGFYREIKIDADATFFQLHQAILDSVNYTKDQITSFFLCSEQWEKDQEITLFEMNTGSEEDNLLMDQVELRDVLTDEKQRLLYIFDIVSERAFFIELKEIIFGTNMEKPVCSLSKGNPPRQIADIEEYVASQKTDFDEDFYGDESFDESELDDESFGDLEFENPTY